MILLRFFDYKTGGKSSLLFRPVSVFRERAFKLIYFTFKFITQKKGQAKANRFLLVLFRIMSDNRSVFMLP